MALETIVAVSGTETSDPLSVAWQNEHIQARRRWEVESGLHNGRLIDYKIGVLQQTVADLNAQEHPDAAHVTELLGAVRASPLYSLYFPNSQPQPPQDPHNRIKNPGYKSSEHFGH